MKKVIRVLHTEIKKITSSKTNIQIVLMIAILFVVSIPYLNQLRIYAIEWKTEQQRVQENKIGIEKENKEREKRQEEIKQQEDLLAKYKITSLTLDDSTDFNNPVYRFPNWILTYVKTLKILDTQKPYTCDNPPPLPSPTPKQLSYFDIDFEKYIPFSKKTKRERFISDCEILNKNENQYQSFQKDIVLIKDLIRGYNSSTDDMISNLTSSLKTDLQYYNDLIGEGNGYININPVSISRRGKATLEYGYKDLTNNEHLASAITTVTVETPSKKKIIAYNAKVYPDDFQTPLILEEGVYWVYVERTVETTSGNKDVLFSAATLFFVDEI